MGKLSSNLSRLGKVAKIFVEYANDGWLFLKHNNFSPVEPRDRRFSNKTIIEAHTIEKGLALPSPRPHFGQDKIRAMLAMNDGWTPPEGDLSRSMLVGALRDYSLAFAGTDAPDAQLASQIEKLIADPGSDGATGGVRTVDVAQLVRNENAIAFLDARFSARDFGQTPLSDNEVEEVLALALRAPSQCNRQSVRVHVYRDRETIKQLLDLQGGGRGFAEAVPTLFVLASEITAWGGPQQRNQPYVDGGIFLTMLLLSLAANGFVSCPMNLAITNRREREIKEVGSIPARDRLIVMVAAGPPPAHTLRAANSPRWDVRAICQMHDRPD